MLRRRARLRDDGREKLAHLAAVGLGQDRVRPLGGELCDRLVSEPARPQRSLHRLRDQEGDARNWWVGGLVAGSGSSGLGRLARTRSISSSVKLRSVSKWGR